MVLAEYIFLGDRGVGGESLRFATCSAVRDGDNKCCYWSDGFVLVEFDNRERRLVALDRLQKVMYKLDLIAEIYQLERAVLFELAGSRDGRYGIMDVGGELVVTGEFVSSLVEAALNKVRENVVI